MAEPEPELAWEPEQRDARRQRCEQCARCERCASLWAPSPSITAPIMAINTRSTSASSGGSGSSVSYASASYGHSEGAGELSATTTRPVPQTQESSRQSIATSSKMRDLEENQRTVSSYIDPSDLMATWDDQQIRGPDCDWHDCMVNDPTWDELGWLARLKCKRVAEAKQAKQRHDSEQPDTQDDEDLRLSRGESLTSDTSTSIDGLEAKAIAVVRDADEEAKSGAQGANGVVLRAQWGSVKVAVKVALGSPDTIKQEIELFKDIHHPHLVACYGILKEKKTDGSIRRSIVTERCTTNLRAFLRDHDRWEYFHNERLTPDDIDLCKYTILEHVSQGLQKLHDMSVLHRDLKSLNILLDGESGECERCHHSGKWKICDFGEAKILRTPTLAFGKAKPWTTQIERNRFKPVTSKTLRDQGARHYCWLHPGETPATAGGEPAGPYAYANGQRPLREELQQLDWEALTAKAMQFGLRDLGDNSDDVIDAVMALVNPYPFGALVYSFSTDPDLSDPRNCVFAVIPTSEPAQVDSAFPEQLRPFHIVPAEELNNISPITKHICLDMENSTYCIRKGDRSQHFPQVDCLHALYPEGVRGHISKLYPVDAMTELDRRRMRIPTRALRDRYLHATHYVFAYQLEQWTNKNFTAKQLEQFQMHSAEISLASYGGFIYLNRDESGKHRVVGINALSLGSPPAYSGGATVRSDLKVSARVASPEMWECSNIGLEADMYAFGIVMWEVITRREAWHWLDGVDRQGQVIMNRVSCLNRRPKIPVDISSEVANRIRKCLCTSQIERPSAKEVGNWLRRQIDGLRDRLQAQRVAKLKESDQLKQKLSTEIPRGHGKTQTSRDQTWSITNRTHETHWNNGMFLPEFTCDEQRHRVNLIVHRGYQSDWEEVALDECATAMASAAATTPLKVQPFGVSFINDGRNHWPIVAKTEKRMRRKDDGKWASTLVATLPQIKPGWKITRINGQTVPPTIRAAAKMLNDRPLALEFLLPTQARTVEPWPTQQPGLGSRELVTMPAWLKGGLRAVAIVKHHEFRQMVRAKAIASGNVAVALVKSHEERQLQERLAAALNEIENLKRQLAARPGQLPEGKPPLCTTMG